MERKGYTKMDHTVFYAEQGTLAAIGCPDSGWYWDYAGNSEPDPHGPFATYDAALNDKRDTLSKATSISNPGF